MLAVIFLDGTRIEDPKNLNEGTSPQQDSIKDAFYLLSVIETRLALLKNTGTGCTSFPAMGVLLKELTGYPTVHQSQGTKFVSLDTDTVSTKKTTFDTFTLEGLICDFASKQVGGVQILFLVTNIYCCMFKIDVINISGLCRVTLSGKT